MLPVGISLIVFLAIVASLVGYLIAAREGRKRTLNHPDDFFLARQRMTSDDFGDTQIAYALQMSTVVPFFLLASTGNWIVPVLNSVFWFVGIGLFYAAVPRFRNFLGTSSTIHRFIGTTNSSRALRGFASCMTIIAFCGVIIFELVYGASVFRVIFGDNHIVYYLIVAFLAAYLMTYIWNGGQTATLRTEQFQLLIAYIGLHAALAYVLLSFKAGIAGAVPTFLPILTLVACAAMVWTRGRALLTAWKAQRRLIALAYTMMLCSLLSVIFALIVNLPTLHYESWFKVIDAKQAETQTFYYQAAMIGTAILLPLTWQFVDLTNWQRICSLAVSDSESYSSTAKRGLIEYLIESPLSWLFPVLLGLAAPLILVSTNGDLAFDSFLKHLLAQPGFSQIIGVFLAAGIVGIFMSTADAGITAIGYAFAYDLWRPTTALIDKDKLSADETLTVVSAGRWFMAIALVVIVVSFVILDWALDYGETFIGLLFAFYTPVICLGPAVLCPVLIGRRPKTQVAFAAIFLGALSGLSIGIYSAIGHPEVQWYPAPIAFVISWGVYLAGLVFAGEKFPTESVTQETAR